MPGNQDAWRDNKMGPSVCHEKRNLHLLSKAQTDFLVKETSLARQAQADPR